ncbi:MAG: hypothetical protein VCB26_13500, partial [Candidatus Hydrogenedentota bacterium]
MRLAVLIGVAAVCGCGSQELITGPIPDDNIRAVLKEQIDTSGGSLTPELIEEAQLQVLYADEREIMDLR